MALFRPETAVVARMTASGTSGLHPVGLAAIRTRLRDPILRKEITYEAAAERLGMSKGALWKFLNTSYVPGIPIEEIKSSNRIRRSLGLPEMIVSFRYRDELGQFKGSEIA
jgi:hypothetical protein